MYHIICISPYYRLPHLLPLHQPHLLLPQIGRYGKYTDNVGSQRGHTGISPLSLGPCPTTPINSKGFNQFLGWVCPSHRPLHKPCIYASQNFPERKTSCSHYYSCFCTYYVLFSVFHHPVHARDVWSYVQNVSHGSLTLSHNSLSKGVDKGGRQGWLKPPSFFIAV